MPRCPSGGDVEDPFVRLRQETVHYVRESIRDMLADPVIIATAGSPNRRGSFIVRKNPRYLRFLGNPQLLRLRCSRYRNLRPLLPTLVATTMLAASSARAASVNEQWKAVSTTAISITGDITISANRITFGNGTSVPLAAAGRVPDFKIDVGKPVSATLFRVTAPDDPVLLSGHRLCGGKPPHPVTFIAVWRPAHPRGGVDLRTIAAFSGGERPTRAAGPDFCGTYIYEPGQIRIVADQADLGGAGIHCPIIFQGKLFMQVTLYDGPPGMQMALKPLQDDAAENSDLKQPVAGSDRWKLTPRPDNRRFTLVCHYSSAPHELWSRQTASRNTDMEIELPAGVSECFQRRRADTTSLGITCR